MSCLIIFLSFICCFKKKYSSTYANSVNPDQTPHVSGLSFLAGTTFLDNFRTKFLSEKISHASFLPDITDACMSNQTTDVAL